jgi:glycosyltransferase involved in cell wall biosynthesis
MGHSLRHRPLLTIDVFQLLGSQWTGIPVFTRRLILAMLRSGGVELRFCLGLARVPEEPVLAALRAGTGAQLLDECEANLGDSNDLIDLDSPLLYPSVKSHPGASRHEGSTVHDLSTLFMPENHEVSNVAYHLDGLRASLASDEITFCVSEATRAALINAFPSAGRKARVLYQYADWPEEYELLDRNLPRVALGRFAAVVGTIEPRKNLALLLQALSLPELAKSELKFVVIGRKGWLVDAFLEEITPEQRERIVFSGYVTEFTKYRLLRAAEFLIFPSLYEGFGIPAVEAMGLGKPVLASRTSSFPEVVGEAGIYFDPLSASDFAAAFDEIQDPRRMAELSPEAIRQARKFGWQQMAAPVTEWACS